MLFKGEVDIKNLFRIILPDSSLRARQPSMLNLACGESARHVSYYSVLYMKN